MFRFYIISEAWTGKDNEHKVLILKFGSLSFLRNNVLTLKTKIGFFLIKKLQEPWTHIVMAEKKQLHFYNWALQETE